ncbi:hypothetical protein [Thalassomonas actiniarum]|uniref:Wadjet protein JetD C-terminal domain-containing protein n=1 Tax=Thalassomonas actiniarum TaxID=485447 RepID=A0AAE9YXR3_9GAMM|nr:hypothetical protein [Thalassomonas actiniarum]WDE02375.1 hypothetical protein SG35_028595 [Thalassomonas actiniarum]
MKQSLNWKVFSGQLLKHGIKLEEINQAFGVTRYSQNDYSVEVLSQDLLQKFINIINSHSVKSRTAASHRGNSHAVNVDGALLVSNIANNDVPYNHLFSKGRDVDTPVKQHCLIIENLECFLAFNRTFEFAKNYCDVEIDIDDVEFVWAAGNSISNALIIPYLKKFQGKVMCLFDIDLGGLIIYSNLLKAGLEPSNTKYLIPSDIQTRLKNSNRKATAKELNALSPIFGLSETTNQIITLIRHYNSTLEQETYRYEL